MEKGRSIYNFTMNCSNEVTNQLIQNYLIANKYQQEEKNGESYYKSGDAMSGYKYFNYILSNGNLTIYAWVKGTFGDIKIEQTGLGSLNFLVNDYRNSLNNLFQEIIKLNGGSENMNNNLDLNNQVNNNQESVQNNSNQNQFVQNFRDETIKKQEKLCEIGFWISILGLLASIAGVTNGVIIYVIVMDFYFSSQGLKTNKRNKAIISIVISILSILIITFQIANS